VVTIQSLVERLASVFAEGVNKLEAMRARDEFFDRAGKVFDDDGDLFEGRMAAFLEWYIIERGFRDGPPPAARVVAGEPTRRFTDEERRLAVHLATSHRGLFEVDTMDGPRLEVDDLMGGARFSVTERRSTVGFEPGSIFEARLLWDGQSVVFGKTFLFHPSDARAQVLALVDKSATAGTATSDVLFQLSRLHVKWHRFGHLSAAKIYGGDT
jgi:hypothetical protein